MGEHVPYSYTSYLSQNEISFIKKCNFCDDLNVLKKILARTLDYFPFDQSNVLVFVIFTNFAYKAFSVEIREWVTLTF
jgi:hypothetical protein